MICLGIFYFIVFSCKQDLYMIVAVLPSIADKLDLQVKILISIYSKIFI